MTLPPRPPLHARFWAWLATSAQARPWAWVIASFVVFATSAPFAGALYRELHTDLRELLPQGAPAAVALESLEKRVGGIGHLSVVIQTADLKAGERFVDALVVSLQPLVPKLVRNLRWKVDDERAFLDAHGALFAKVDDLTRLRDGLRTRVGEAKKKANPLLVDLEEDDAPADAKAADGKPAGDAAPPPALSADDEAALRKLREEAGQFDHFLDGYLAGEDGRTLVVIVTPSDAEVGLDSNQRVFNAVDAEVRKLDPKRFHPSMRIGYDGDVKEVIEAQEHLIEDIGISGVLVLVAVGAVILLFYRTWAALPLAVLPLFSGVTLTFALSRWVIHYLNPNTAFLGSIIIGNGINAGLILLARYLEERRKGRPVVEALPLALATTWLATLAAAGAAAASYGSLAATQFRGFNQFAFMGGTGMLLCWVTTYLFMPGWIVLIERVRPLDRAPAKPVGAVVRPLARLLAARPGVVVAGAVVVSLLAVVSLVRFAHDPIEYDFSRLGSRSGQTDGAAYFGQHLDAVMQSYLTPTVILTDAPERAEAVADAIEAEKKREGPQSPIDAIHTLGRLLPKEQPAKLELLREIFGLVDDRVIARLPEDVRPLVRRLREKTQLREVTLADLPDRFTWVFHEKDGQSGRLVLVYPTLSTNSSNGRAQQAFARALRNVATATDARAQVAGGLILTSDIVETITADGRFAALLSFGAVILLTIALLRSARHAGWVLGSLFVGTLWMGGALGLFDLKLNFVNFVVLPITFGIGVDYAVNLYQRYRQDGDIVAALVSSGGAVALCSATTIIGYATLIIADNRAIFSFGVTAVLGEVTCLSAALLALPAALAFRRGAGGAKEPGPGAVPGGPGVP